MKASSLCFQAAVVCVVVGLIWGIQMAITEDHSAFPAHAHLNLLGWVSLVLIGIYYRLRPSLERSKVALTQVWVWIAGTVILTIGVGLVHTGRPAGEPLAAGGSFIVLAAMLLFGWLVFQTERADSQLSPAASPAE